MKRGSRRGVSQNIRWRLRISEWCSLEGEKKLSRVELLVITAFSSGSEFQTTCACIGGSIARLGARGESGSGRRVPLCPKWPGYRSHDRLCLILVWLQNGDHGFAVIARPNNQFERHALRVHRAPVTRDSI